MFIVRSYYVKKKKVTYTSRKCIRKIITAKSLLVSNASIQKRLSRFITRVPKLCRP